MNGKEVTASSTSKHPLVVKILIDLDEYRRLKNLETLQKQVYSKKQKELQNFKPEFVNNFNSQSTAENPAGEGTSSFNQTGGGNSGNIDSAKPVKKLVGESKIKNRLQETLKLEFENFTKKLYSDLSKSGILNVQQGGGSNLSNQSVIGYVPQEPDLVTSNEEPTTEYHNFGTARQENLGAAAAADETFIEKKNISSITATETVSDLTSLVPPGEKSKAAKIIQFCLDNPDLISWDNNKVLTIVNTTYPKSNIKTYLRRLYIRKKSKDLNAYPGLVAFTSLLLSSGLGHLFYKKNFISLSRKSKQPEHQNIPTNIRQFEKSPWYFLSSKSDTLNAN